MSFSEVYAWKKKVISFKVSLICGRPLDDKIGDTTAPAATVICYNEENIMKANISFYSDNEDIYMPPDPGHTLVNAGDDDEYFAIKYPFSMFPLITELIKVRGTDIYVYARTVGAVTYGSVGIVFEEITSS